MRQASLSYLQTVVSEWRGITVGIEKGDDKWLEMEEKIEELKRLIDKNCSSEEWELAALGQRVLRTCESSREAGGNLRANMDSLEKAIKALRREVDKLKEGNE